MAEPAAACPHCNFTLRQLDPKFGTTPLHNRFLTDRAQSLTLEELERLRELLQGFENKFPQLFLSVFVTDLPDGTNIGEYTFWLLNRAQFSSVDSVGAQNFDLLLVIEPTRQSAALAVGYGLEKYVSEEDLHDVLVAAKPALRDEQLEGAIRICIEELTSLMSDACAAAAQTRTLARANADEW